MKYRKKPIVIDAIILKDNPKSIYDAQCFIENKDKLDTDSCMSASDAWDRYQDMVRKQGGLIIKTLEGNHLAAFGDYIIKGVKGEFYPCKPDIFELTYDKA